MFLVTVAVLSVIIGLIRKGSLANIIQSDMKASFLFILSLLLFIAVQVGDSTGIAFITSWMYFIRLAAYCLLLLGIILNLNVWMFILLLGAVMNFVVIFINGGKLPVAESALQIAGIATSTIQDSSIYALTTAATNFPFLGGIIPIPLPSIFAQVISPGIAIMAVGLFGVIQNILLGIVYEYDDEEENDDANEEENEERKLSRKEKKALKNKETEEDFFYDDEDDDDQTDDDFGKDYTMGNINISDLNEEDDDDVDESIFTTQLPDVGDEEDEPKNDEKTAEEILDEILNRSDDGSAEQENSGIEEENLPAEDSESVDEAEEQEELAQESEPEPEEETVFDSAQEEPAEVDEEEVPEQESAQIDPDAIRYADAENSDLMPTNNAILEANELIEQTPSNIEQKTETVADDIDTDSPFVIVNGRIVENPYYKFKKGAKKEASEGTAQIDSGVYVVRSRNPSLGGKPNFVPPNKRITETKPQDQPQASKETEEKQTQADSGYEKVEMKIGDVQIKFWKKDNDENK